MLLQLTSLNLQGSHTQHCSVLTSLSKLAELRAACLLQNTECLTALSHLSMLVCGNGNWYRSGTIQSSLLPQLRHLELFRINVRQISALQHAAQSSSMTGMTALSLHSLAIDCSWYQGSTTTAYSEGLLAIASMAQLKKLRICDAESVNASITVLSACQQLKALHIGLPKKNPLQLTSLTYLSLHQNHFAPLDLASTMPIAQLRELHIDYSCGIQVSQQLGR